jgi:hypothetical protein
MVTGKLKIMGQIETVEPDGENQKHGIALLIEFDSVEDIRAALKDMECKFAWDTE